MLPATTQLVAPPSNTSIANRRKPWRNPANRSSTAFTLPNNQPDLLLSTCSAMDRRTYEGPMDWEYQSQPPVDHSSPFAKFSQKQPACRFWTLLLPLFPVTVQPSAAQFSLSPPNCFASCALCQVLIEPPPHSDVQLAIQVSLTQPQPVCVWRTSSRLASQAARPAAPAARVILQPSAATQAVGTGIPKPCLHDTAKTRRRPCFF